MADLQLKESRSGANTDTWDVIATLNFECDWSLAHAAAATAVGRLLASASMVRNMHCYLRIILQTLAGLSATPSVEYRNGSSKRLLVSNIACNNSTDCRNNHTLYNAVVGISGICPRRNAFAR